MCVESSRTKMSITPDIFFHGEEKSGINSFILGAKFKLLMDSICEFMTLMNSEPQNRERTHILVDSSTSFYFFIFFFHLRTLRIGLSWKIRLHMQNGVCIIRVNRF